MSTFDPNNPRRPDLSDKLNNAVEGAAPQSDGRAAEHTASRSDAPQPDAAPASGRHQLDEHTGEEVATAVPASQANHDRQAKRASVDRAMILGQDGRWLAGWALRFIVLAAAAYILWMGLGQLWTGLLPILLAIPVCTVLWPPVRLLRKWMPNALAVALTIIGAFGIFGGILAAIAPSVTEQSKMLWGQALVGIHQLQGWVQGPPLNIQNADMNRAVDEITAKLQGQAGNIASGVFTGLSTASSVAVTLGVMLVLTFFFLKDGDQFLPLVRRVTGQNVGWHLTEVLTRTWNTLAGFIRAQALVSLLDAIIIGAGLLIMQIPMALALAVITFFAGFIPIVGAVTAGALAVLIALVSKGVGMAIAVLVLIIIVQQLEGNVLSPMLQSKAMDLHPVIVLLGVTVGGTLFGIVGAFLAVPVAATLAVWLRYHGDMVSLRSGEITADEIEIATANTGKRPKKDPEANKRDREAFRSVKDRFAALGKRS